MRKLKLLFVSAVTVSFLSGCGDSVPEDWVIQKESSELFSVVNSELLPTEDENVKIIRIDQAELLNSEINSDDFFVFDYGKLLKTVSSEDFYTYKDYRNCSAKIIKKELNNENLTIDIYFEGNDDTIYGAIFNKSASFSDGFVSTIPDINCLGNSKLKNIDNFEEKLLKMPAPKEDATGYVDLIRHFGKIFADSFNENSSENASLGENFWSGWDIFGIIGIILQIGNWVWNFTKGSIPPNYHNMLDLSGRVSDLDSKLTNVSNKLTSEFGAIILQADFKEIGEYTRTIGDFKNNFVSKMNDYIRTIEDELAKMLRNAVNNGSLLAETNYTQSDGNYIRITKVSRESYPVAFTSSGTITFAEAKKYLESYNRVDGKFVEYFVQDIVSSMSDSNFKIPPTYNKDDLSSDIFMTIIENGLIEYCNNVFNSDSIENFRDLVIDYLKQFYAANIEIVNKYVRRCILSYNFGSEVKKSVKSHLAGLQADICRYAAFAQMLCRFPTEYKISESSLTKEFLIAYDLIQKAYRNIENYADNYCFRDGKKWESKLFQFEDVVEGGWYPGETRKSFNHYLETKLIVPGQYAFGNAIPYDRSKNPWADSISLRGVNARYHSLNQSNAFGENKRISFLDYFHTIPKLINPDSNRMLEPYAAEYHRENVLRFIGDFSTRLPAENEEGMLVMVVGRGYDPHWPYFQYHEVVEYKKPHDRTSLEYWRNGKFYTCDTINGDTGEFKIKEDLTFCCDYLESHKKWVNDELWAMSGVLRYFNKWADGGKGKWFDTTYRFGLGVEVTQ